MFPVYIVEIQKELYMSNHITNVWLVREL
jgi:hypothetical protein